MYLLFGLHLRVQCGLVLLQQLRCVPLLLICRPQAVCLSLKELTRLGALVQCIVLDLQFALQDLHSACPQVQGIIPMEWAHSVQDKDETA